MERMTGRSLRGLSAGFGLLAMLLAAPTARGHCDTLDGPVVMDARAALEAADVTGVLKWVRAGDEAEIRQAFARTLEVRKLSPQARDLADTYFFETLVRVHRAGEGAPYTGLKPAGTDPGPAIRAADKALEAGSADQAVALVTEAVAKGIQQRFEAANSARAHAGHNVQAGRQFVAAYVEFMHYVERLYDDATTSAAHADGHDAHVAEAAHAPQAHAEQPAPAHHEGH